MSTTPRPTWYAGEYGCRQDMYAASVALPIFNQHDALVAKVAAYEFVLTEVKDSLTLSIVEDETPPGYYLQNTILPMIDAALGDQR